MESLFSSGRIVDLILVLLLLESVVLLRQGARRWIGTLAAGAFLLLALRAAMVDAGWIWVAAALAAAGIAHAADVVLRFRTSGHA